MTLFQKIAILFLIIIVVISIYWLLRKPVDVMACKVGYYKQDENCLKCTVCKPYQQSNYLCDGSTMSNPGCKSLPSYLFLSMRLDGTALTVLNQSGQYSGGLSAPLLTTGSSRYIRVDIPALTRSGLVYGVDYKFAFNNDSSISITYFDEIDDNFRFKVVSRSGIPEGQIFLIYCIPITARDIYVDLRFIVNNGLIEIVKLSGISASSVKVTPDRIEGTYTVTVEQDPLTRTVIRTTSYNSEYLCEQRGYTPSYTTLIFTLGGIELQPPNGSEFGLIVMIDPNGSVDNVV